MGVCRACGTEVPEGARFCQNCGTEIADRIVAEPEGGFVAGPATVSAPAPVWSAPLPIAPGAYPPPPYAVVPSQAHLPTRSGKAIAGMWLGIASIPAVILTWVGVIIGTIGLVLSLLALREIRHWDRAGVANAVRHERPKAIAGALCSIIGITASSALFVYILTHLDQFGIHLTR